jgi:peptide deformylase
MSIISADFEVERLTPLPVRPLVSAPDPVLNRKTMRVKQIDAGVHRLVEDMIETMHNAQGVGLAANQVGVPLKIAVIQLPDDEEATVLINPQVIRRHGEREADEGCLSIPGYQGRVKRSLRVIIKAQGLDGKPFRVKAEGDLRAQALEHETDHLDGRLYIERLVSKDQLWKIGDEEDEDEPEPGVTEAASSNE